MSEKTNTVNPKPNTDPKSEVNKRLQEFNEYLIEGHKKYQFALLADPYVDQEGRIRAKVIVLPEEDLQKAESKVAPENVPTDNSQGSDSEITPA